MTPLEKVAQEMWPGAPVVPVMDTGATDGAIPAPPAFPLTAFRALCIDIDDDRSHGRDERMRVASFYDGVDFYYRFSKR